MLIFPTDLPEKIFNEALPDKSIKFVGRENDLIQITQLFSSNPIVIINSFGGVGKTTLAHEYCNRLLLKDSDSNIRWFNADSSEKFEIEYKKLSKLLDINVNDEDLDFIVQKTNMKLKEFDKEILFVFDNLENFRFIETYIKRKPKSVKILITTRNQLKNIEHPKIELKPFEIEEGKYYVNKNLDKEIDDDIIIDRIIELAKSTNEEILPIKLEKIISYINYYFINDILKSLSEIENSKKHHDQVEYTLFLKTKINDNEAFELLQYCSILNPDFISFKFLLEFISKANNKEGCLQEMITTLTKLSLISFIKKNKQEGVKIHRLVQEELVEYGNLNKNDEEIKTIEFILKNVLEKLEHLFAIIRNDPKEIKENEEFYLHSLNIYEKFYKNNKIEIKNELEIKIFNKVINYEYRTNKIYKNLHEKCIKLEEICEKFYKSDHPDLAHSLNNLGLSYDKLDENTKSLEYFSRALEMRQRLYDYDNADLAQSLNNVGASYSKMSEKEKALEYFNKALEMRQRLHDHDHPDIAQSLNNVGVSYDKLNEYKKALEYKLKSLEMTQRLYDYDHPDIADSLNNVAISYDKFNEHKKVSENQNRTDPIEIQPSSDENQQALPLNNIEISNQNLKELELEFRALEITQTTNDTEDLDLVQLFNSVGPTEDSLNENKSHPIENVNKTIDMRKRVYDYDHPDLAKSLNYVGLGYDKLNENVKALEYKLKSLEMRQRLYDYDHPDIAESLRNVGVSYDKLNDDKKASEFKLKALEMRKRLHDSDHSVISDSLNCRCKL